MAFENRVSQYPNRKRLSIVSTIKDSSGNITGYIVDEIREEGIITKTGTALTAENIINEINNVVEAYLEENQVAGSTQPVYDSSLAIATTEFVWNVLIALGHVKINNPSTDDSDDSGT